MGNHSYTVIFEPLGEGGYEVIIPAIPTIVTYGRTLKEAKEMATDAIKCHLEGLTKDGEPIPKDIDTEPVTEKLEISLAGV
ncbi:type II toxin-antitoxin system HicB family antitoxin [Candidatus Scalindua japonica]|nr:type II toxin-antitoxin system HicB family antitoxin [Candidatus Scalindua japonica]